MLEAQQLLWPAGWESGEARQYKLPVQSWHQPLCGFQNNIQHRKIKQNSVHQDVYCRISYNKLIENKLIYVLSKYE